MYMLPWPAWPGRTLLYAAIVSMAAYLVWQLAAEDGGSPEGLHPYRQLVTKPAFWIVAGAGVAFTVWHAAAERFIYFWDTVAYWKAAYYYYYDNWNAIRATLDNVYGTIKHEEYNLLPTMLVAPGINALGYSLPAYTGFVFLCFQVPFGLLLAGTLMRGGQDMGLQGRPLLWLPVTFTALIPPLLLPLQQGLIDAVALPFTAILLAATYLQKPERIRANTIVAIGLAVFFLPITRRYFGIWVLAWFMAYGGVATLRLLADKTFSFKQWRSVALSLTLALLLALGLWAALFMPFLTRSLLTDYGDLYKAYQRGNIWVDLSDITDAFGPAVIGMAALGLALAVWRGGRNRWFALTVGAHLVAATLLHLRLNNFSPQHYYLIAGDAAALCFFAFAGLYRWAAGRLLAWALAALLAAGTLHSFMGLALPDSVLGYLSRIDGRPRVRPDLPQVQALTTYLNELTLEGRKTVYVACSGYTLNDDILDNAFWPERVRSLPGLAHPHSHVDRRDGFPQALLSADFVVVSTPVAYHLHPDDQQIVGVFSQRLQDTSSLGRHYRTLRSTQLDGGLTAIVLQKTQGYTAADLAALRDTFARAYPDYPRMREFTPWPSRIAIRTLPGTAEAVVDMETKNLLLKPTREGPAQIDFDLYMECRSLSFTPQASTKKDAKAPNAHLRISLDGKVVYDQLITPQNLPPCKMNVSRGQKLNIQFLQGPGIESGWVELGGFGLE